MVNKFCPKKHMCIKYKYNDCEGCEDAHTIDMGTKNNFKVKELTYSEYKNKGDSKMTNKDCPYRCHCRGYAFDKCEGCNENIIRASINSIYGTSIYKKSNIDIPSAYPDMVRMVRDNMEDADMLAKVKVSHGLPEHLLKRLNTPMRMSDKPRYTYPDIKKVKISGPCTIIFWEDGTKTVMRCSEIDKDRFDPEKAILLAFYRKVTGFSKTHSQKELNKLTNEAYDNIFIESAKEK